MQTFYHGTAAKNDFTSFQGDLVYLAPNIADAKIYAENFILAKGKQGKPRVLVVLAKNGLVRNIDAEVINAIFNDYDVDEIIETASRKARIDGYRYLEFEHPGVEDNFLARISLYPNEDLIIQSLCV